MTEKSKLKDKQGRPLTQGLFLEINYNPEFAVFTLKDEDYEYEGEVYVSLKRLYLEEEDPTEYGFATKYLLGWQHWRRLCDNKRLYNEHIRYWQEELELRLRCKGVQEAIQHAQGGTFQAAKWLADKGWDDRPAGRPTKAEVEEEKKFQSRVNEEYGDDIARIVNLKER